MDMSLDAWLALGLTAVLLSATAALWVAGRSLDRLQRLAWAGGARAATDDTEAGSVAVETAFISLSLARQLLLVALVCQLVVRIGPGGRGAGLGTATAVSLAAYVLFDKLLPYWVVVVCGGRRVLGVGDVLFRLESLLLGPISRYLSGSVRRARARHPAPDTARARNDLGAFLDLAEAEGLVIESDDSLLRGVADFEEAVVREVMTPRVDIVSIEDDATLGELHELIARHRLSRIPVIHEDLDHVVGVAHLKDLVAALEVRGEDAPIGEIRRPAWFVPESKQVSELLPEFQRRQAQLTIVVDEHGGTSGLVTLEDVLEEIVGEIQDESEQAEPLIQRDGAGVRASGKAEVEDVERALSVTIPEGDFHTVGGMVFTHLGHVPMIGERLDLEGLRVEVLEADDRRVRSVRITPRVDTPTD